MVRAAEDLLLLVKLSESLRELSEETTLPADAKDLESLESSSSCSGIASESLLDISEDQRLVTLARESIDRCPIISYLLEDVENDDILVTECRLSLPTSMDESRDMPEYRDPVKDDLLSLEILVKDDNSLGCSKSGDSIGDGLCVMGCSGDGVGRGIIGSGVGGLEG